MSDLEDRLAEALASTEASGDSEFVDHVMRRVAARERRRRLVSVLATIAAVALLTTLCHGLSLTWAAIEGLVPGAEWRIIAPLASIALAALVSISALPSVAAR